MIIIRHLLFVALLSQMNALHAQQEHFIAPKVTLTYHPNIETYFIAEKLAVQHIGNFIFSQKDSVYGHQPLLAEASKHFIQYVNTPCIIRIADILKYIRDNYHDDAEIIQYLLFQKPFPQKGEQYPFADSSIFRTQQFPGTMPLIRELTDSLHSFYQFAHVADFIKDHQAYYDGALHEVKKDLRPDIFAFMEKFYGEQFYRYAMYIMPLMPITYGDDNYRAFGPTLHWPKGRAAVMVFSSSKMLPPGLPINTYTSFGFDNAEVTHLLTVHEFGHSFVNPHLNELKDIIARDTALFTPALQKALEPAYIGDWFSCVVEHIVRLGEIRVAESMHDATEANRLRSVHVKQARFVLIPLLEEKIKVYEANRKQYPDFNSFLPELLKVFHELTPEKVDGLVK